MTEDGQHDAGGELDTTNQRMELTAVLRAIETLSGPLEVISDSTYVVNCFNDRWYDGWIARGWKNAQKKPVANRDIWEPLIELYLERIDELSFTWVKAHSGIEFNEVADQLAVAEVAKLKERLLGEEALEASDIGPEPPWPIERAVAVTGVRELDADQVEELDAAVANLDSHNDIVVSGLRIGAELRGAEKALELGVPLAVVLPFPDPVRVWSSSDRARFDAAIARASWSVTLDGDPAKPGPAIRRRNRWLWSAAVGAVVVGDDALVEEAEMAGLGVLAI